MRVLIAEDDLTSRLALIGILKKKGHEVIETKDGGEAWNALQQENAPRMIILDWMMPVMSGIEVVQRIRSLPTDYPPYLILLTAKSEKSNIVQGLDAGADDYLPKPFDTGELLARLNVGQRMLNMQGTLAQKIKELKLSEEKRHILLEKTSDLICSCSPNHRFKYVNSAFAREIGRPETDIIGSTIDDIVPSGEAEIFISHLREAQRTKSEQVIELSLCPVDREKCYLTSITPVFNEEGSVVSTLCSSKDITERKRIEAYREMGREILHVLNEPDPLNESIHQVLDILKNRTGFDAVGIRLQDGEDFPYLAQRGFPADFHLKENTLIGRDLENTVCRDEQGKVLLECTCGLVITGNADPKSPFFSPGGSFWTNDSFPLAELPAAQDPRFKPRNVCIQHQYASMALIPIRNQEMIIGLLHFNDKRKDRFTADTIATLEGIAAHIGAALLRKQAEDALREKRKQLNDIINFLPDATMAIDHTGRIIIWNKAMEQMTGLTAGDMIGQSDYAYSVPFYNEPRPQLIDLIFAEDKDIKARYPQVVREGDTLTTEVLCDSLYGGTGAWVFAKASPLRDQNGGIVGAIETIRDITYKKQMEEKLKKNISWFKALFNATSDSVMLVKPDGMILDLNNNAALRRHLSKKAMRGKNIFDFLSQEASTIRAKAIDQILQERSLVEYDEIRQDKHYHIRLYPILDDQGQVIQVASFSRDVTENIRAELETKRLQDTLVQVQKMEALGTLAGGIAHDFNNILSAILGYSQMARHACPNGLKLAQYLDRVLEAGERATQLVKQILMFSRKNPSDRIIMQPAIVIKETLNLLRPSLPSTITIIHHRDQRTDNIYANPTQVQQILMNLCVNAAHAMEETGGELEISLLQSRLSRQELVLHPEIQPGAFIQLIVRDSGVGIPTETIDKIFDPYFTTKGIGKGSGMGLSIVLGLVTSFGGFVTCESKVGNGTTFRVFFPAHQEQPTENEFLVTSLPRGKGKILYVDDEVMIAELGRTMLESLGYQPKAVTSSEEALRLFQSQPSFFDAVITDQTMPGMTGSVLAQRLLQIRPDLPIILCTGYSSIISEEKSKALGIKGFAMKPLILKDLALLLKKVLEDGELLSVGSPPSP
ncbi:MAG: PAS domain-containing protein [Desulfobulbus sp.]|nr:PAS domain-containing protein [Desulfobulbus sp.]